jgi:hypothetical protein
VVAAVSCAIDSTPISSHIASAGASTQFADGSVPVVNRIRTPRNARKIDRDAAPIQLTVRRVMSQERFIL